MVIKLKSGHKVKDLSHSTYLAVRRAIESDSNRDIRTLAWENLEVDTRMFILEGLYRNMPSVDEPEPRSEGWATW